MARTLLIMLTLIFGLFFQSCKNSNTKSLKGKSLQLVDVRTPDEFQEGSVPDAINIPLSTIEENISAFDTDKTIVVFCRSGNRSGKAKKKLEKHGFKNVTNGGPWQAVEKSLNEE